MPWSPASPPPHPRERPGELCRPGHDLPADTISLRTAVSPHRLSENRPDFFESYGSSWRSVTESNSRPSPYRGTRNISYPGVVADGGGVRRAADRIGAAGSGCGRRRKSALSCSIAFWTAGTNADLRLSTNHPAERQVPRQRLRTSHAAEQLAALLRSLTGRWMRFT